MGSFPLLFWILALNGWIFLVSSANTSRPALTENIGLDLITANGYQWRASLPNGSKLNKPEALLFLFSSSSYSLWQYFVDEFLFSRSFQLSCNDCYHPMFITYIFFW